MAEQHVYVKEFETCWKIYPPRLGGNPKWDAYKMWRARVKDGVGTEILLSATERYRTYCDGTGRTHSEYVMQARRFYGTGEHYLEAWTDKPALPSGFPVPEPNSTVRVEEYFDGKRMRLRVAGGAPEGGT